MRQRPRTRRLVALAAFVAGVVAVPSAWAWTVTMDAQPALKRTHSWKIEKSVSQSSLTLKAGESATVTYSVTVSSAAPVDSDWSVSGKMEMTDDPNITVNSVVFKVIPEAPVNTPGDPGVALLHADDLPGRPRHRRARVRLQRRASERGRAAGLDAGDRDRG